MRMLTERRQRAHIHAGIDDVPRRCRVHAAGT
jgi:hypothetical protein